MIGTWTAKVAVIRLATTTGPIMDPIRGSTASLARPPPGARERLSAPIVEGHVAPQFNDLGGGANPACSSLPRCARQERASP